METLTQAHLMMTLSESQTHPTLETYLSSPLLDSEPSSATSSSSSLRSSLRYSPGVLSLSLLYPDTAPRSAWRPQLDAWMKKNHPSMLKEIAQMAKEDVHIEQKTQRTQKTQKTQKIQSENDDQDKDRDKSRQANNKDSKGQEEPKDAMDRASDQQTLSTYSLNSHTLHFHAVQSRSQSEPHLSLSPAHTTAPAAGHSHGSHSPTLYTNRRLSHDSRPYSRPATAEKLYTTTIIPDQAEDELEISRAVDLPSPPESPSYSHHRRRCISCGSDQSPCWRPSWSSSAGQLCNSCGLRYKKTGVRCINPECCRIPAKGEWATMRNRATKDAQGKIVYACLSCGSGVGIGER